MNELQDIISNIGFPISMTLIMVYYLKTIIDNFIETNKQLSENISNIDKALTELTTKIELYFRKDEENE